MQFITDNYIWFIVGGIVILMAVIGYIADKTDFGRNKEPRVREPKPEKPKKEKKIKIVESKPEKIEVDAKGINELTQSLIETNKESELPNDLFAPLNDTVAIDESLYAPLMDTNNDIDQSLYTPITDTNIDSSIEQSLYAPLESTQVDSLNTVLEDVNVPLTVEPIVMPESSPVVTTLPEEFESEPTTIAELPNVEPTTIDNPIEQNNEPITIAEDDDVWKF